MSGVQRRRAQTGTRRRRDGQRRGREDLDLASVGAADISFDEQVEIIGQINEVLSRNRLQITADTFSFTPRKRGTLTPALINAGAVFVLLLGGFLLLFFFNRQERSLVSPAATVLTAEAKVLEAFKRQSQQQLSEKNREITRIQARLEELRQEKERLRLQSEVEIRRRETELRAELQRQLEAERQKLQGQGLASASIEEQLGALESRLAAESQAQLDAFRQQAGAELAAKQAQLARLEQQYANELARFQREKAGLQEQLQQREAQAQQQEAQSEQQAQALESERSRIAGQLAELRDQRQKEQLVFDQVLSYYARVEQALQADRYQAASAELQSLESFLAQGSIASLPAVQQRLPTDRFMVASLRSLIAARTGAVAQAAAAAAGGTAGAGTEAGGGEQVARLQQELSERRDTVARQDQELSEAQATLRRQAQELGQLRANLSRQNQELQRLGSSSSGQKQQLAQATDSLAQQSRELAGYREAEKRRAALRAELSALRQRYDALLASRRATGEAAAGSASQQELLSLLETKLKVREALASEAVSREYPDLYGAFEGYLSALSAEQQQEGQAAALRDVVAAMEAMAKGGGAQAAQGLAASYRGTPAELFASLLSELEKLLK
jgi:hypothetical protein